MARARRQILHLGRDRAHRLGVGGAHDRRYQPSLERDRNADVGVFEAQDAVARPHGVGSRHAAQSERQRADDEIVEREPEQRGAVAVFRRRGIDFLAQRLEAVDRDIGGHVEMRNALLRLEKPRRDGAAHGVERHLLVARRIVERLDLFGTRTCRCWRRGSGRGGRCGFHVARDNAAARAGTAHASEIDAGLGGKPARQRGHRDAAREPRRAEIAFRRAHLEERVELDRLRCAAGMGGRSFGWSRRRGRGQGWRAPRGLTRRSRRLHLDSQSSGCSADDADNGADRRGLALLHADFAEHAGFRRRHFHRHLVGLDLEQIVARLNGVAGRFEPFGDLAFGDRLAELRHEDVHASLLSGSFRGRANGSGPTWPAR